MGEQLDTSQRNMILSFIDAASQISEEFGQDVHDIAEELKEDMSRGLDDVDNRFDTSVKHWVNNEEEIRAASDETRDEILDNIRDFEIAVGEANINVSTPLNEMEDAFNDVDKSLQNMNKDMGNLFNLLEQKSGVILKGADAISALQSELTNANNSLSEYVKQLNDANKKIADQDIIIANYRKGENGGSGSGGSGSGGSGSGGSGSGGSGSGKGKGSWAGAS